MSDMDYIIHLPYPYSLHRLHITLPLPADKKAADHTHLQHQNRRLSEELAKLSAQAKGLEDKLKEKDNKA